MRIRLDIDETDVAKIRVGQPVRMKATEHVDTKILETLVDLDPGSELPLGLRVDAFINL